MMEGPWCLYLAALVCWAGHGGVKEEIVWDALGGMRGFLEGIFKQGRDRREGGGLGIVNGSTGSSGVVAGSDSKKGGNSAGMITVIAKYCTSAEFGGLLYTRGVGYLEGY